MAAASHRLLTPATGTTPALHPPATTAPTPLHPTGHHPNGAS
ncbi:hypothetical protein ACFYWD_07995 [Streptomyces sp. NPDC003781]